MVRRHFWTHPQLRLVPRNLRQETAAAHLLNHTPLRLLDGRLTFDRITPECTPVWIKSTGERLVYSLTTETCEPTTTTKTTTTTTTQNNITHSNTDAEKCLKTAEFSKESGHDRSTSNICYDTADGVFSSAGAVLNITRITLLLQHDGFLESRRTRTNKHDRKRIEKNRVIYILQFVVPCFPSPLPSNRHQMMIVWMVRAKIIRSVLCNIVRNNCA